MKMAELKTIKNDASVREFLENVENEKRREDSLFLLDFFQKVTGFAPKMWGNAIVGFGEYHYVYASGREGDWPLTGFSPRKQSLTNYIMSSFNRSAELMSQLGKYTTGKSCLYVKKLEDIQLDVLKELIELSIEYMKSKYDTKE